MGSWIDPESYLAPFYQPGHASQALEVTSSIIRLFRTEALARGSLPLIVLIPIADDLFYIERENQAAISYCSRILRMT